MWCDDCIVCVSAWSTYISRRGNHSGFFLYFLPPNLTVFFFFLTNPTQPFFHRGVFYPIFFPFSYFPTENSCLVSPAHSRLPTYLHRPFSFLSSLYILYMYICLRYGAGTALWVPTNNQTDQTGPEWEERKKKNKTYFHSQDCIHLYIYTYKSVFVSKSLMDCDIFISMYIINSQSANQPGSAGHEKEWKQ